MAEKDLNLKVGYTYDPANLKKAEADRQAFIAKVSVEAAAARARYAAEEQAQKKVQVVANDGLRIAEKQRAMDLFAIKLKAEQADQLLTLKKRGEDAYGSAAAVAGVAGKATEGLSKKIGDLTYKFGELVPGIRATHNPFYLLAIVGGAAIGGLIKNWQDMMKLVSERAPWESAKRSVDEVAKAHEEARLSADTFSRSITRQNNEIKTVTESTKERITLLGQLYQQEERLASSKKDLASLEIEQREKQGVIDHMQALKEREALEAEFSKNKIARMIAEKKGHEALLDLERQSLRAQEQSLTNEVSRSQAKVAGLTPKAALDARADALAKNIESTEAQLKKLIEYQKNPPWVSSLQSGAGKRAADEALKERIRSEQFALDSYKIQQQRLQDFYPSAVGERTQAEEAAKAAEEALRANQERQGAIPGERGKFSQQSSIAIQTEQEIAQNQAKAGTIREQIASAGQVGNVVAGAQAAADKVLQGAGGTKDVEMEVLIQAIKQQHMSVADFTKKQMDKMFLEVKEYIDSRYRNVTLNGGG